MYNKYLQSSFVTLKKILALNNSCFEITLHFSFALLLWTARCFESYWGLVKNKVKIVPPCEFSEQRKNRQNKRKRKIKELPFLITFMVQRNEKEGKQKNIFKFMCTRFLFCQSKVIIF